MTVACFQWSKVTFESGAPVDLSYEIHPDNYGVIHAIPFEKCLN